MDRLFRYEILSIPVDHTLLAFQLIPLKYKRLRFEQMNRCPIGIQHSALSQPLVRKDMQHIHQGTPGPSTPLETPLLSQLSLDLA